MSSIDNTCRSKPPKFKEKRGAEYLIWDIKFRSWAWVKGISTALTPSFDSELPGKESNVMDNTDPLQKAQGIARMQHAAAMDTMVQSISATVNFHHILQSMKEDADWPGGKAWKTWMNIQKHYQSKDSTFARDMMSALYKIKLKK
jgi:hypothetical protein